MADAVTKKFILPVDPRPVPPTLPVVYPWETTNLYNLCEQLYALAAKTGYTGTFNDFKAHFGEYLESDYSVIDYDVYTGQYSVTPLPDVEVILRTHHRFLTHDVVVEPIPYNEVDNTAGGVTVMIG